MIWWTWIPHGLASHIGSRLMFGLTCCASQLIDVFLECRKWLGGSGCECVCENWSAAGRWIPYSLQAHGSGCGSCSSSQRPHSDSLQATPVCETCSFFRALSGFSSRREQCISDAGQWLSIVLCGVRMQETQVAVGRRRGSRQPRRARPRSARRCEADEDRVVVR